MGLLPRVTQQYHWVNEGYGDFDGFLAALSSRKRKAIRKERATAVSGGITIRALTGDAIEERHWEAFWTFYQDTGARKWGTPYLTRRAFREFHATMRQDILLVLAFRGDRAIAGALNFIGRDTLYGRYWGCTEDHPCLHFELCYYQAIDWAIAHTPFACRGRRTGGTQARARVSSGGDPFAALARRRRVRARGRRVSGGRAAGGVRRYRDRHQLRPVPARGQRCPSGGMTDGIGCGMIGNGGTVTLTLYTNPMSRGRIAHWMMEEVGEACDLRYLGFGEEMATAEYRALNPMGKVPTLVHDGRVVTECAAICLYLAEAFPDAGLMFDDRAAGYRWMIFAAGPLEAAITDRALGFEPPVERAGMVGYGTFDRTVDALETAVTGREFIAGSGFSCADVYVGSQIGWGLQFKTLPDRPAFRSYWNRLKDRPALCRANAADDALSPER